VSAEGVWLADSHCHLDGAAFDEDRAAVLARARAVGVDTFVVIGCSAEAERRERARAVVAAAGPGVALVSGVHPHAAQGLDEAVCDELRARAAAGELVGLGETGLDYHYDFCPPEEQRAAFRRSLRLAQELDLPVVIHTREAEAETVAILEEEGLPRAGGVIHCFSSAPWLAERALALGLHLGFTGMITYAWAGAVREVARGVPGERLLVETDSPYLGPAPRRLRRNEPGEVRRVAEALAELRGDDLGALAAQTRENCRRLFRL